MKEQFKVPQRHIEAVKKQVAKWQKKAAALECDIPTITISDTIHTHASKPDSRGRIAIEPMVEITIEGEAPKLDEWRVVARLTHRKFNGHYENIITFIDKSSSAISAIKEAEQDLAPSCDHCEVKRYRKTTFLLTHKDSGETIQIGSTCLEDFTRNASLKDLVLFFDIVDYAKNKGGYSAKELEIECSHLPIEQFVALTLNIIDEQEFVSKREAEDSGEQSTASRVYEHLFDQTKLLSGYENKNTKHVLGEIMNMTSETSAFAVNLSNALMRTPNFININNGHAVAIVIGAIGNVVNKLNKNDKPIEFLAEHAGLIGQRTEFELTFIGSSIKDTDYGLKYTYYFMDAKKRKFKWTCWGKEPAIELIKGCTVKLTGTISKHEDFGTPTTVINRCAKVRLVSRQPD